MSRETRRDGVRPLPLSRGRLLIRPSGIRNWRNENQRSTLPTMISAVCAHPVTDPNPESLDYCHWWPKTLNEGRSIEPSQFKIDLGAHRGEVVLRDIGPVCQFWLFPQSAIELENWWRSRDTFHSNPDGLWDEVYAIFGETVVRKFTLGT